MADRGWLASYAEGSMRGLRAALCACVVLAGCATAYHTAGFTGGYSDTQLAENVFQVSFRGNGYTSRERVEDFALLRSAEVSLEHGFPYFVVVNAEGYSSQSAYTTPTTTTGSATVIGNTVYGSTVTSGGQTYVFTKPSSRNTIVCFKEKPDGVVYEAQYVIRSVRQKYGMGQ